MKRAVPILMLLAAISLAACSEEPAADRIAGSYSCEARLDTRYMKNGKWRDTSYISATNNSIVITKIDDNHVAILASSKKWGDIDVASASISDYNYEASFSGTGTLASSGHTYDADVSGTMAYESHSMAVSARITNYPQSNGKYILTFYNRNY